MDIPNYDKEIVAVHYEDGWIESVKLDTGEVIPISSAIILVENGIIPNCQVSNRDGREYIKGRIDQSYDNNLDRLPRF